MNKVECSREAKKSKVNLSGKHIIIYHCKHETQTTLDGNGLKIKKQKSRHSTSLVKMNVETWIDLKNGKMVKIFVNFIPKFFLFPPSEPHHVELEKVDKFSFDWSFLEVGLPFCLVSSLMLNQIIEIFSHQIV